MDSPTKSLELNFERLIAAKPDEVFAAWLDPKTPGSIWHVADKFILNAEVDGLFYWQMGDTPHYGRFTRVTRPSVLQHTWVSPYTEGLESLVTITFKKQGKDTLLKLVHAGLPHSDRGRAHNDGWTHFLGGFQERFAPVGST
jgi:uncharacterized protein YndB with AHSA1/START domain